MQRFRRRVPTQSQQQLSEPVQYDERGVAFSACEGKRKSARAEAVVYEQGSGRITVNGIDYLLYFPVLQDREQLMFPFHFLDRLGKHDVTCTVSGGGDRHRLEQYAWRWREPCAASSPRKRWSGCDKLDCLLLIHASENGRSRAKREPAESLPGRSAEGFARARRREAGSVPGVGQTHWPAEGSTVGNGLHL